MMLTLQSSQTVQLSTRAGPSVLIRQPVCRNRRSVGCSASSNSRSAVSSSLISVLKDELKYERDYYRREESLLAGPPNDFDLDDPEGKNAFYLLKEYKNEAIVIEVDLDNQPEVGDDDYGDGDDDDKDDDSDVVPVKFRVSIGKQGSALIFECESNGEVVVINHLAFERASNNEEEEDDTPAYTGPVFDELDDTLQQAFLDYLEERGISAELGEYMRLMCLDKTALEYQAWLQRVRDFIAQ